MQLFDLESSDFQSSKFDTATDSFQDYFRAKTSWADDSPLPLQRIEASLEYTVVWLHCGDDIASNIRKDTETKLRNIFINVYIFCTMEECLHFLQQLDSSVARLFFVSSCFYNGMVSTSDTVNRTYQEKNLLCFLERGRKNHQLG